jgi:hypothetical protein
METKRFDFVTLIVVFDIFIEIFNCGYIFGILGYLLNARAVIFHMSIAYDKTFPLVPKDLAL